jgi:hypothetical protein
MSGKERKIEAIIGRIPKKFQMKMPRERGIVLKRKPTKHTLITDFLPGWACFTFILNTRATIDINPATKK